jgi:hypothetical protein
LNGSKLTFDPAAIDFYPVSKMGSFGKTGALQRSASRWPVWFGRILKEQLPKNQTASLPNLSGLSDSRLTRFQKFNSGLTGV